MILEINRIRKISNLWTLVIAHIIVHLSFNLNITYLEEEDLHRFSQSEYVSEIRTQNSY